MKSTSLGLRAVRAGIIAAIAGAGLSLPATADHEIPRPQPRQHHAAFQLNHGQMVILGGESDSGALGEEWVRHYGEWSYRPTAFPARYHHTATVLDRERRTHVIMIGGTNEMGDSFDGIWRRDRRSRDWILIGRNELVRRTGHTAVAGPRDRSILIFGGERDGQKLSDTARMTFDRYGFPRVARIAANAIPARDRHTMTWVPNIRRFIVQGGRGEGDVALSDTYIWDDGWIRIADAPFPARYNHTIHWDDRAKRLIAMGGTDGTEGTEQMSDVWAGRARRDQRHVIIDWVKISDDAVGAHEGHSVVYNGRSKKAVLFGGMGPDGGLGDTHKVKVERTAYGSPTIHAQLVDDFTQDGDPVTGDATGSPADFDGNGTVDMMDIMSIYASWGACTTCPQDLDGDGYVRASDVAEALGQLGASE